MSTMMVVGQQSEASDDYEIFMKELKRKHLSWNVDWDMGIGRNPVARFVSANVETDEDGAFRVPTSFAEKYRRKLYYHLHLKCKTIVWNAIYDMHKKKICGLQEFMRFYDLKMYSVVLFEYYGNGNFTVHCCNHNAVSIAHPTVEPVDFFHKENYKDWNPDEFIYGRNHNVTERYLASIFYNAFRHDPEEFFMVVEESARVDYLNYMALPSDLDKLYNKWKGLSKLCLRHGCRKWQVQLHWSEHRCLLGNEWFEVVKELDICEGDVIAFYMAENQNGDVYIVIFKKKDVEAERIAGDTNGRRSFFKIVCPGTLKHGYIHVPSLLGAETKKQLLGITHITVNECEFQVRYDGKYEIIYGLKKLINYFGILENDSIWFRFDGSGDLLGRIFMSSGMEITTPVEVSGERSLDSDNFFLFEDVALETELLVENVVLLSDMEVEEISPVVEANPGAQEVEMIPVNNDEIVEDGRVVQFCRRVFGSNLNNRCHGAHIPQNIKFRNEDWKSGDMARFRTERGLWSIKIVLNHKIPRFSGGWSKFIKDHEIKENDILRFTLREDDDIATFDIEVNPASH